MCGRYALVSDPIKIEKRFGVKSVPTGFSSKANVAPGSMVPIITSEDPDNAILAKWGLIPSWAKDPKIGYKMINARAETLLERPAYRKPFIKQRCLIPADGFYEWLKEERDRIPFYFHLKDDDMFAFAGLYDIWKDAEGKALTSFTIITTDPNSVVAKIHDRMPVVLPDNAEREWINPGIADPGKLMQLLHPRPGEQMISHTVSREMNNPENDTKHVFPAR